ncbi:MAG: hypothetical protein ACK518_04220 [bacterium]
MSFFEDTLMEWDKHKKRYAYSMRRITIAVVFPYALIIGIKASFYKTFYALEVFQTSFAFVAIGLGINLVSYMKNKQEEQYNQQQPYSEGQ